MAHQPVENDNREKTQLSGILEKVAIGAMVLVIGYQQTAINTLDGRIYTMQGAAFTEEKGRALEDRLTRRMESMSSDTQAKLDTILLLIRDTGRKQ
jgi:hypothetical protein